MAHVLHSLSELIYKFQRIHGLVMRRSILILWYFERLHKVNAKVGKTSVLGLNVLVKVIPWKPKIHFPLEWHVCRLLKIICSF